jgi:flagellar hook-associated protein 1
MGLSSALATAMSGLRSTQAALSIISSNVGNAQTPGYIAENPNQIAVASGGFGSSVEVTGVNRQLDLFVQGQLRTEIGGGAYADQINNILGQLQSVYGNPGGDGTLETTLSNFTSALQALSSNPGNGSAQSVALSAAQSLAQQLNKTTQGIQSLRTNVDQDIGTSATRANGDLKQIAQLNLQIQGLSPTDPQAVSLMDQRDSAVSDLAKLVDVKVSTDGSNQTSVFTSSGIQLVGSGYASQFIVNSPGALTPGSLYNANPALSGVSSLNIRLPSGALIDAVSNNVLGSGQIAADLKLRDQTLVQAQTQVDQLAATLASSLSDVTTPGTTVAGGFNVDTTNLLPGNTINLTYTDASNVQHQVQIVDVTDPAALPLKNATNANPQRIGIDFSQPMSSGTNSVLSQLSAAFTGTGLTFSNPSGATLTITGAAPPTVNTASTTTTTQSLTSGNPQLPLFTDSSGLYTGAVTASGPQMLGLAGRIAVNPALVNNRAALSVYSTSPPTPSGDNTRSDFLFKQLTSATFAVSPQTGLGSAAQPFKSTVSDYLQQFMSQQSNAATMAKQLQQGQSVVVSTLQQKFDSTSKVNIDTEMANLIQVQNTYAANAHIMSVVQSMMQTLLQVQP